MDNYWILPFNGNGCEMCTLFGIWLCADHGDDYYRNPYLVNEISKRDEATVLEWPGGSREDRGYGLREYICGYIAHDDNLGSSRMERCIQATFENMFTSLCVTGVLPVQAVMRPHRPRQDLFISVDAANRIGEAIEMIYDAVYPGDIEGPEIHRLIGAAFGYKLCGDNDAWLARIYMDKKSAQVETKNLLRPRYIRDIMRLLPG